MSDEAETDQPYEETGMKLIKHYEELGDTPLFSFPQSMFIVQCILESSITFMLTRLEFDKSTADDESRRDEFVGLTAEFTSLMLLMLMGRIMVTIRAADPSCRQGDHTCAKFDSTALFKATDFYSLLGKLASNEIHRTDIDCELLAFAFITYLLKSSQSPDSVSEEE